MNFKSMSASFKKYFDGLVQNFKTNKTARVLGIVLVIIIVVICGVILLVRFVGSSPTGQSADAPITNPTAFPEQSAQGAKMAVAFTPTVVFIPTATPIPSNLWTVKTIYEQKEVHFGFSSLVIDFENTTTKEIKKGHCQSPHDPAPKAGDTFIFQNTTGDVWLFSPYDTAKQVIDLDSKVQRFRLIQ